MNYVERHIPYQSALLSKLDQGHKDSDLYKEYDISQ